MRRSLLVTSNQPFREWDDISLSGSLTVAAVDRLVCHCHIIGIKGESYREMVAAAINAVFVFQKPEHTAPRCSTKVFGIFANDTARVRLVGSELPDKQEEAHQWCSGRVGRNSNQLKCTSSLLDLQESPWSLSCAFGDQGP